MSEREVRAALARICSRLEQRAARHGLPRGTRGVLLPMLLGFGLVGAAACEGTTESDPGGGQGGVGGLDAGAGGDGLSGAGGTDPGGFDAYGSPFPEGGGGTGGGGLGGLGGGGGDGGAGGMGGS